MEGVIASLIKDCEDGELDRRGLEPRPDVRGNDCENWHVTRPDDRRE